MARYKSKYTKGFSKSGKGYEKKIANRFETFIWQLEKVFLRKIHKKYLKGSKKISYMDFACGTGRIISYVGKFADDRTGVDTSATMMKEARKKINADYVKGNIVENKNLLKGKKFDLITSFRLFLNLEDKNRQKILRELPKHLKDSGFFIVNNHMNRYSIVGFQFFIRKLLGQKGIINTMSELYFRKILKKSGFKVIKTYRFAVLPGRKNMILLPEGILRKTELLLSKIPIINLLGKDQIFVCKKSD